jgi:tetratricopeptide (TPR) repeat protein
MPLHDLGRLCLAKGAWSEASEYGEESSEFARRSGNASALAWAQMVLAEREIREGRAGAAAARLKAQLERPLADECPDILQRALLAWATLEQGDAEAAEAQVIDAVERARAAGNRRALAEMLPVQQLVFVRRGRIGDAERVCEEGLALARHLPYPFMEARLLHVDGLLQLNLGDSDRACERLQAALSMFRTLGARADAEQAEQQLAGPERRGPV